jgi:hypothetical protein
VPIEARIALIVPWIAISSRSSVIARAPIGFEGEPPEMSSGNSGWSRLTRSGGDQAGATNLPAIRAGPLHSFPRLATATG